MRESVLAHCFVSSRVRTQGRRLRCCRKLDCAASRCTGSLLLPASVAQPRRVPPMHRSLSRARCQWISSSLHSCRLQEARNHVVGGMEFSRSFMEGSLGHLGSSERSKVRLTQVKIVNALRSGERGQASELLSDLTKGNEPLRHNDFLYILDYCSRSPDPLFALETWRLMQEKEMPINRRCCMFIIQALSKGGHLKEAYDWLTFLGGGYNTNPILPMYNSFLNGCAVAQSLVHADYCLEMMDDRQIGKSEITYWELLKLAVLKQNLSAAHEIWKECNKYYSPSIISLRKFVLSFTRLRDLGSAIDVLQSMVGLVLQRGTSISTSADGQFISSRLDIPIPSKKRGGMIGMGCSELSSFADSLVKIGDWYSSRSNPVVDLLYPDNATMVGMKLNSGGFGMWKDITNIPVMKVLRWSFSDVIHACAQSKNCKLAEQLFLQMHKIGLEPTPYTYDGLVKALISERGVIYGMSVVKAMWKRKLKPCNSTLEALSVGYSRCLELDLAESLLDQIDNSPLYIHPFNALLAACDVMDQPERAVRILAKMSQLKLKYDIRTYELLFSLFSNVNAPYKKGDPLSRSAASKRLYAIKKDMGKNRIQHSCISMEILLKALGAEGMIKSMMRNLYVADRKFCHTSTYTGTAMYNSVLHALVEAKKSRTAIKIFKNMKRDIEGVIQRNRKALLRPGPWWLRYRSWKQLIRKKKVWWHRSHPPKTSYWLNPYTLPTPFVKFCDVPPDRITYNIMIDCCSIIRCFKSASALVSMMIRDGFPPDISTYTALIKVLLKNGDFDGSLNLISQAISDGIRLDVITFNTILLRAYRKSRIDIIEFVLEQMHQEKIQPDPSTCAYAFSTYVNKGFLSTAIESLQILSLRMISEEETILQEQRMIYEELVLDEDPEAESRIIEIFKYSDEHLAAALLNLRWCAINGFSILWNPNESSWARRLSSSFGPIAS